METVALQDGRTTAERYDVISRQKETHSMGFMDKFKGMFGKGMEAAAGQADKVEDGIDKAADVVDDKTGGKYSDQIDSGAEKAKDLVEGMTKDEEE